MKIVYEIFFTALSKFGRTTYCTYNIHWLIIIKLYPRLTKQHPVQTFVEWYPFRSSSFSCSSSLIRIQEEKLLLLFDTVLFEASETPLLLMRYSWSVFTKMNSNKILRAADPSRSATCPHSLFGHRNTFEPSSCSCTHCWCKFRKLVIQELKSREIECELER